MKRFPSALIFLLLSFIGVLAQEHSTAPASGETGNWVNVAPEKSGFILLMPGKATEKIDPVPGSPGVQNHSLTFETPTAGYVFSYVQFLQDITDANSIKGMLDAGREGALSTSGAKLKGEKEIKLEGHYGREWQVELPDGLLATNHAYWVRNRLYQLVFVVATSANDTPATLKLRQDSANKFFGSFRLVNETGK